MAETARSATSATESMELIKLRGDNAMLASANEKLAGDLKAARMQAANEANRTAIERFKPILEGAQHTQGLALQRAHEAHLAKAEEAHGHALHRAHAHGYHAGAWQIGIPLCLVGLTAGILATVISVDKTTDAGARSAREMAITGALVSGNRSEP